MRITAAEHYRLLLELPEARSCLPGCLHPDLRIDLHAFLHQRVRERSDAAHAHDHVECEPFPGQECPCWPLDLEDNISFLRGGSVLPAPDHSSSQRLEDLRSFGQAGQ